MSEQEGISKSIRGVRMRMAGDLVVILTLIACMIAISAHAPSNTYMHAQLQQIGAVIGTIQSGEWILPRDQGGALARKPQLYAWLDAPILMLTGIYNDFTFRLPTVVGSFVTGVLVYFLARRWGGRRVGLLAACLWAVPHHMTKAMYVAVTDMMLSMWVLASIMCADRVLFHPAPQRKRTGWVIGLWVTMILGAMTKGWGVLNLILVGGTLGLATGILPGFAGMREVRGVTGKVGKVVALILTRWANAMKATRFGWGMLGMAVVLAPVWIAMFAKGGEEFRQVVHYEFWSRITGQGETVPHSSSVPAIGHLLYYALPTSLLAVAAVVLTRPRRWFSRDSFMAFPLCWILAVVVPFSLTHGFRHDYLLPAYPPLAIMAAWAVHEVSRRGQTGGRMISVLRHVFAGTALTVVLLPGALAAGLLFRQNLPQFVAKSFELPPIMAPETWWMLTGLVIVGMVGFAGVIWASLRWRVHAVVWILIAGMLGVGFVYRHAFSRPARTGDGERMLQFARGVRPLVGGDEFAVARMTKLATELYLGRFGLDVMRSQVPKGLTAGSPGLTEPEFPEGDAGKVQRGAWAGLELLRRSKVSWLITCDRGLVRLGAAEIDRNGPVKLKQSGKAVRFRTLPRKLGRVELLTRPVISQRWGRMYLIRLDCEKLARALDRKMYARAAAIGFESGRQD